MEKGYVKRLIFWGVVWLIIVACAGVGIYMYFDGHGEMGKIRQKLVPIADRFNGLSYIVNLKQNNNTNVTAKVKQDKIVITYITDRSKLSFDFVYSKEGNYEVLTNKYNTSDSYAGELISRGMIDAVYLVNSGTGSVFDTYERGDFTETTVAQGVNIINGNDIQTKININANIVDNMKNSDQPQTSTNYINEDDLTTMLDEIDMNNRYEIAKNDIKILVINTDETYEIYAENSGAEVNDDFYNSIINIVRILSEPAYNSIIKNEERFNKYNKTDIYEVTVNAEVNVENTFNEDSAILKLVIKK